MARPLRINYPGAVHHVTARGNDRQAIVRADADRQRFVRTVAEMAEHYHVCCYAWVLMENHYHPVLETPQANLIGRKDDMEIPAVQKQPQRPELEAVLRQVTVYSIDPIELIAGALPRRQHRLVEAWAELHQAELLADWQRLQAGRKPQPIEPLK